jgi:hypothetical protein
MAEHNTPGTTGSPAERTRAGRTGGQQGNGSIVNRMKQSATEQLTSQKDRGIDALGSVAQAVRSSTQKLRDENHDTIASYVDTAADQIETWSRRLKEKDINELLTDVQRVARRQPAAFIASAFALGLVAARFLKSSRPQNEYGYGSDLRRNVYGGRPRMSAAGDRGSGTSSGGRETATAISDMEPAVGTSSPQGRGRADRSDRTRREQS